MAGCGQPWPALAGQVLTKKPSKTFQKRKNLQTSSYNRRFLQLPGEFLLSSSSSGTVTARDRSTPGSRAKCPRTVSLRTKCPRHVSCRTEDARLVSCRTKEPRLVSLRAKYPRHVSRRAEDRAQFFVFKLELKSNTEAVLDKLGLEKIMTYWGTILQKPKK